MGDSEGLEGVLLIVRPTICHSCSSKSWMLSFLDVDVTEWSFAGKRESLERREFNLLEFCREKNRLYLDCFLDGENDIIEIFVGSPIVALIASAIFDLFNDHSGSIMA